MPAYNARRENGVCRGSLWKQHCATSTATPSAAGSKFHNDRGKYHDYCVLVGNTLTSYPDRATFKRGEFPTSEIRIVGASSWTPVSRVTNPFSQLKSGGNSSTASPANIGSPNAASSNSSVDGSSVAGAGGTACHQTTHGNNNTSVNHSPTFRIVTFAGTHVYCTAPNVNDRNVWLAALHSGLEASYTGLDNLELLSQIRKERQVQNLAKGDNAGDDCANCGAYLESTTSGEKNPKQVNLSSPARQHQNNEPPSADLEGIECDNNTTQERTGAGGGVSGESSYPDDDTDTSDPWDVSDPKHPRSSVLNRQQSAERRALRLSQALDPSPIKKKQTSSPMSDGEKVNPVNGVKNHVLPANNTIFTESDLFSPPRPQHLYETSNKYCKSCGAAPPPPNADHTVSLHQNAVPLPHYNAELRVDYICNNCLIAQGVLGSVREWNGLYSGMMHERAALNTARSLCVSAVDKVMRSNNGTGRSAGNSGNGVSGNGMSGSGLSEGSQSTGDSWENLAKGAGGVKPSESEQQLPSTPIKSPGGRNTSSSWHCIRSSPEQAITSALLQLLSTPGFATLRRRSKCLDSECQRLERVVVLGVHAVVEFLENLDSMCGIYPPIEEDQDDLDVEEQDLIKNVDPMRRRLELKKEALKISGDMTTAMKLLHDNALGISNSPFAPPVRDSMPTSPAGGSLLDGGMASSGMHSSNSLDMLTCLLELLLDLCEEGELAAVTFFWPQLRHIHLTMLPPINATEMCHVELVEDFLLTVACKYSVQLALELVWGCLADLEEGLGHTLASHWSMVPMEEEEGEALPAEVGDKIRHRRWCVMRFLCELESLMFGFEGGWGGGKVCLRGTLTPSEHQSLLIREAVTMLQVYRLESPYYLSRSVRRDLLRAEKALLQNRDGMGEDERQYCLKCARTIQASGSFHGMANFEPTVKLNTDMLMRNAHFLSSQLNFIRKLSEVAEKLRFLPVNRRNHALKSELKKINLYLTEANRRGRIGAGDPIATATFEAEQGNGSSSATGSTHLTKIVHLPINEGHVFRSKARTPVLLVFEVMQPPKPTGFSPGPAVLGGGDGIIGKSRSQDREDDFGESKEGSSGPSQPSQSGATTPADVEPTVNVAVSSPALQDASATSKRGGDMALSRRSSSISADEMMAPQPPSPSSVRGSILQRLESPLIYSSGNHPVKSQRTILEASFTEEEAKNAPWAPNLSDSFNNDAMPISEEGGARSRNNSSVGNHSRHNSHQGGGHSMEDMTELVQTAMQDKLALSDKTVKMPKLEEMGGASDPAAAAAARKAEMKSEHSTEEADATEEYRTSDKDASDEMSGSDIPAEELTRQSKIATAETTTSNEESSAKDRGSTKSPNTRPDNRRVVTLSKNVSRKMTALGGASQRAVASIQSVNNKALQGASDVPQQAQPASQASPFGLFSQERREVLSTILATGMKGNPIAKGAAAAAQKSIQNIDRRNALGMMEAAESDEYNSPGKSNPGNVKKAKPASATSGDVSDDTSLTASQLSSASSNGGKGKKISSNKEEDECLESLRLILLQNRVAQGNLTPEGAARALVGPEGKKQRLFSHFKGKDAGEVDPRLAGCGHLSHAIHSALKLWKEGTITNAELLELAHRDQQFVRQSLPGSENMTTLIEDSAFWVRFAFGERWAEKKSRISARSPYGRHDGWDLVSVIVKSNDDLRQEAFVMQLIQLCKEAFELAGLELWLLPYRIVSTGKSTGIIETLQNTLSFDAIKKKPGYTGLRGHFERMTEFATDPKSAFAQAQSNFVRSLAAYSLLSYLFQFKDRHNGNLMLDTEGHMVHIDFGFVFGIAPGGAFSLEGATPFKLTDEMIEVMGGLNSSLFSEFVTLFSCGFLALQQHCDTFCTLVEITCRDSPFPCFAGKDPNDVVEKLRCRFCPSLDKGASVAFALDLIKQSLTSYGTRQYDFYQYMSQGIAT